MNSSKLYDQNTFYPAFLRDLRHARHIVIIESPFMTERRIAALLPTLRTMAKRGVRTIVNTKPFDQHTLEMKRQAIRCVKTLQGIGVEALMRVGHHRKFAIIDDIVWEGSLNILSQYDSCEIMRRTQSKSLAKQMIHFTRLSNWI